MTMPFWNQETEIIIKCRELWGVAQLSRHTLQNEVSHRCACVKLSTKGGYRTIRRSANYKVSRHMGYRNDRIAILRDIGDTKTATSQSSEDRGECSRPSM